MPTKRSDETTSSDGTDELFEDAVDTLRQVGGGGTVSPVQQPQWNGERFDKSLKCPPPGPPPPLPLYVMSSTDSSPSVLPTSPTWSAALPPPLPPRKPLPNGNTVKNVVAPSFSSSSPPLPPPFLPPATQSVSAPSVVLTVASSSLTPLVGPPMNENDNNNNNTMANDNSRSDATNTGPTVCSNASKELIQVSSEQPITVTLTPSCLTTSAVDSHSSAMVVDTTATAGTCANSPSLSTVPDLKSVALQQQSQFGRQRGHVKTNSLDRGLSLAKSMKTGPFPPPVVCSKSNSLTRGASPIEALPILDEQDQSASTVIQSVIQQVLSENNTSLAEAVGDDGKEEEGKKKKPNGGIVHHASREMMDSDDDKRTPDHGEKKPETVPSATNLVVHYENLADDSLSSFPPSRPPQPCQGTSASTSRHKFTANITTNTNINSTPSPNSKGINCASTNNTASPKHVSGRSSHSEVLSVNTRKQLQQQQQKTLQLSDNKKFHRRSASDRSPAKLDKTPLPKGYKPTHQKSSTWEPHQAQQQHRLLLLGRGDQYNQHLMDMMDPITRDVERRMSLKAKEAEAKATAKTNSDINNDSADDDDDVFGSHQHRHTGLDHVRRFARSYGAGAVDFFRGAVRKAKQIPENLTKNVPMPRSTKKSEMIAAENEDGASSIADSDIDQLSIAAAASEPNAATPVAAAAPSTSTAGSTTARKWRFGSAEPSRGTTPSVSVPTTSVAASTQGQRGMNSSTASASVPSTRTGVCRPKNAKKGPFDFENLALVQEMNNEHTGAVWCVKFSGCGRLLATAGQDRNVRVWVLHSQLKHFAVSPDATSSDAVPSSPPSPVSSSSASSSFASSIAPHLRSVLRVAPNNNNNNNNEHQQQQQQQAMNGNNNNLNSSNQSSASKLNPALTIFAPKPLCVFRGHTADVLDLSWSPRNYFLLSSGMDRTAKLWHLHRNECLCSFQHIDFVTCLAFLPKDDRYFISGSLDGKIRLWHIPEKKVAIWNEVEQVNKFITAMTFVKNGKFVVIGTFLGRCFFYSTDQLKYHTVIDVRSSRGKNSVGHKITSLAVHGDKLLVASDDSRIRIYDLRDMDLCCKFKGAQISQSLIRAAFSPDGSHVISGSEDAHIYLWRTGPLPSSLGVRKDRNHAWERIRAHQSAVITAVFAPKPQLILKGLPSAAAAAADHQHIAEPTVAGAAASGSGAPISSNPRNVPGAVIVSADLTGSLKVFMSQFMNLYLSFCLLVLLVYVQPN